MVSKQVLYVGDAIKPIGNIHYINQEANIPPGFYQITEIVYSKKNNHYLTYGTMLIPVIVAECRSLQICHWINNPTKCEHSWHLGPKE